LHEKFIARQPIFDTRLKVFAYELLFRSGPKNVFQPRKEASSSVIVDSSTLFDLQTLTGPHAKAFINVDEAAILRGAVRLLPHHRIVVEILETVPPTPEVVRACKELHEAGYVLALDDFVDHPKWEPLLPLAKFLKVDFRACGIAERAAIARRYASNGRQLLAEKVETDSDVQEARKLGYSYFQGFFFCKPSMIEGREVPANKLVYLQLLAAISAPEISYPRIEELLKQDPSLIYKLLRYLNSPLVGLRKEVRSIREAIALIGDSEFRRWVSIVAIVAMSADKPPELVRTAVTRAYFCEEIARTTGMATQSSDLFLMGLLSVTDALLDLPIDQILKKLPVSSEVQTALCGGSNSFRDVYDMLLAYERADWNKLSATATLFDSFEHAVPLCYLSALNRASAIAM